jgi:hypothetical protein
VGRLYKARKGNGNVVLRDSDTNTEILLEPDLPDEAYQQLLKATAVVGDSLSSGAPTLIARAASVAPGTPEPHAGEDLILALAAGPGCSIALYATELPPL